MENPIANPKAMRASQVLGRFAECQRRLEEAGLTFDALQWPIDDPDFRARLVEFWMSRGERGEKEVSVSPNIVLSSDMRKEGWRLLEHTPRRITSIVGLELVPVLKSGESCINGEEMVRRARLELNANFGQEDAEWLLEHQNEIPKEWRNYYISFPGMLWRGSPGVRRVPCLYWDGGQWYLRFSWLGHDWDGSDRLLSFSK